MPCKREVSRAAAAPQVCQVSGGWSSHTETSLRAPPVQPARARERWGAPERKVDRLVELAGVPDRAGHVVEDPLGVVGHDVGAEQQACAFPSQSS